MAALIPGVENIGKGERRKRLVFGAVFFLVAVGLATGLIVAKADPLWRLTVAVPLFLGGLGFFQARAATCVMHAARGTCNLDQGDAPVTDATLQARLTRKAKQIVMVSALFAGLCTAALTVLPF